MLNSSFSSCKVLAYSMLAWLDFKLCSSSFFNYFFCLPNSCIHCFNFLPSSFSFSSFCWRFVSLSLSSAASYSSEACKALFYSRSSSTWLLASSIYCVVSLFYIIYLISSRVTGFAWRSIYLDILSIASCHSGAAPAPCASCSSSFICLRHSLFSIRI